MSQKIGLHVLGRRFDVDVDDEFATFLLDKMANDFNQEGNNDIKTLLQAYVRKTHELYSQELDMKNIINKLDDLG
ncbi:hypothetical protein N9A28_08300 [Sulfurimonas sp.]|nr:hypothetical protein [Sulfurimonas sp.]